MGARTDSRARRVVQGAVAGAAAASVWAVAEPHVARGLGQRYTDGRPLGRFAGERAWLPVGVVAHVVNGAAFGAAIAVTGPRTFARTTRWVAVETVATWPLMAVADRVHPDRRSGRWPRLLTNPRTMAQAAIMHGVFAVVLGALLELARRRR